MGEDDVELVGLYWTLSGPVEVHSGREWSLFDLADRCTEAAKAGFKGIGIWHADLEHVLETRTLTDVAVLLEDNGLKYLELECLMDWFLPPQDERRQASDKTRQLLFEASGALHAHHIKVTNIPGVPFEIDALTQAYAELCAQAADHTDARVVYEFMPHDVNVQDLDTALAIVEGAGAPNGGLCIDTWHMTKLRIAPEDLKRIPEQWLAWVELSDGQIEWMADDDHVDEVINHRALPGEGEFDIPGYIAAVRAAGYQGPWGVEVLSEDLRNNPLDVICRRAHDTTASQFLERSPLT
jgi:sugar phosphate isomerase/epimerase